MCALLASSTCTPGVPTTSTRPAPTARSTTWPAGMSRRRRRGESDHCRGGKRTKDSTHEQRFVGNGAPAHVNCSVAAPRPVGRLSRPSGSRRRRRCRWRQRGTRCRRPQPVLIGRTPEAVLIRDRSSARPPDELAVTLVLRSLAQSELPGCRTLVETRQSSTSDVRAGWQRSVAASRIAACLAARRERAFRVDRGNSACVPSGRRTRSVRPERS